MLGQVLVANEDAGDTEHDQDSGDLAFPAHVQPPVGAQPGGGALDLVPDPAQSLGGLDPGVCQAHSDPALA